MWLNGAECYAICRKENNIAIGSIELILNSHTDMTERMTNVNLDIGLQHSGDEAYAGSCQCTIIRHGFEDLA